MIRKTLREVELELHYKQRRTVPPDAGLATRGHVRSVDDAEREVFLFFGGAVCRKHVNDFLGSFSIAQFTQQKGL